MIVKVAELFDGQEFSRTGEQTRASLRFRTSGPATADDILAVIPETVGGSKVLDAKCFPVSSNEWRVDFRLQASP